MSADQKSVCLKFDFLDKNDGLVCQLIHDGRKSNDLRLMGSIKGAKFKNGIGARRIFSSKEFPRLLSLLPYFDPENKQHIRLLNRAFLSATRLTMFSYPLLLWSIVGLEANKNGINWIFNEGLALLIMGILMTLGSVYFGYALVQRRVPPSLGFYEDDLRDQIQQKPE